MAAITSGPMTIAFEGSGPWLNRHARRAAAARERRQQKGRVRK